MSGCFETAVADPAVAVGDEPGDGAFDHGPVLAVVGVNSPSFHAWRAATSSSS